MGKDNPNKPARWIVQLFKLLEEKKMKRLYNLKMDRSVLDNVKPPYILIYNHVGYTDHIVTGMTIWPDLANFMVVKSNNHLFNEKRKLE